MELARNRDLSFRGRGSALRVVFESPSLPGTPDVLRELRDAGSSVTGRPLVFDFKELEVSRGWILDLMRDVIFPLDLTVTQWSGSNEKTQSVLASLGFKADGVERPVMTRGTLQIVTAPLRSGQSLNHDGDVLMLGDLHSGAEINATGSIVVLGTLLGQVHAGCGGDNGASVITLSYQTNQLRIGSMISNAMEPGASPWWGRPVRIFVQSGVFVADDIARER